MGNPDYDTWYDREAPLDPPALPTDYLWRGGHAPEQIFRMKYLSDPRVAFCPGLGGLTDYGWPKGNFGRNDQFQAYEYCQPRKVDIRGDDKPWNVDLRYSTNFYGGILFHCIAQSGLRPDNVPFGGDPRHWTHQNVDGQIRNDGSYRRRTVPIQSLIGSGWYARVNADDDFNVRDAWWMER